MHHFPVDNEVVETVWKRANPKPFENLSFNSALRRVLGLVAEGENNVRPSSTSSNGATMPEEPEVLPDQASPTQSRSKAPKADLRQLVRAGLLSNREELFLLDYQGNKVKQYKATLMGRGLQFKGQHYSMSLLARDLLQEVGFQSDFVRGPAHWVNSNGISVKDLWQQFLDKQDHK